LESNALFFYTGIDPKLKKRTLFYGSSLGALGALSMVNALFYPNASLTLFLSGIGAVALGLIPYKRLCRFENAPVMLRCFSSYLTLRRGKSELSLNYKHIRSVHYHTKSRSLILRLPFSLTPGPLKKMPWKAFFSKKNLEVKLPHFSKESYINLLEAFKESQ